MVGAWQGENPWDVWVLQLKGIRGFPREIISPESAWLVGVQPWGAHALPLEWGEARKRTQSPDSLGDGESREARGD